MDVGNFLQLERAFERDRIVDAASEEQEILRGGILAGDALDFLL